MIQRFGDRLPRVRGDVPGPRSRALAERLREVESRNIAPGPAHPPIFWRAARGANVRDVDGNTYVDLTGGFGVAAAGHANPRVAGAIARQARRLAHGLGDVHPPDVKVELLERLAALAPDGLSKAVLASAGAEAVEAALKTALLATGRPGVIAFDGAYHGLTYGALAVTGRREFRDPFRAQLHADVRFAPYPDAARGDAAAALEAVRRHLLEGDVGAVIVEPVQGRGGLTVPAPDLLPGLRDLCDAHGAVLIFDEIYTGFGRTGRWFACEHAGVAPDVLLVGKALAGSLPLSAAIGTPAVMDAWPEWAGEALHTSTFLGNPIACAAALANLREIGRRGLVARADALGDVVARRIDAWIERFPGLVVSRRGIGLFQGARTAEMEGEVETAHGSGRRERAGTGGGSTARRVVSGALRRGVLLLAEGPAGDVLAFTPPLTISRRQLEHALDVVEEQLEDAAGGARASEG